MRKDENGGDCPSTLTEYRAMCEVIGGPDCAAVKLLDRKILESNGDEKVIVPDSQMRMLLMPLLFNDEVHEEPEQRDKNHEELRRTCGTCRKNAAIDGETQCSPCRSNLRAERDRRGEPW